MSALLRRLLFSFVGLWGVITLSFALMEFLPGDPADLILGDYATAPQRIELRARLGLNEPLLGRYRIYLTRLAQLDFGQSLFSSAPIGQQLKGHLGATLELGGAAMLIAVFIGLPLGLLAAVTSSRFAQFLLWLFSLLGASLPAVVVGPVLVYFFSLRLHWLPVSERGDITHLVLPALSLAFPLAAALCRMTRVSVREQLTSDHLRTAIAKGLPLYKVYLFHALRVALPPIVTLAGLQLGAVLTGTVITETLFDWPGLGSLLLHAIRSRDYPLIQSAVLTIACIYLLVNWLTDAVCARLSPHLTEASA